MIVVIGPGGSPGKGSQFDNLMPWVALAMVAGPTISGLLMTGVVGGLAGYRDLIGHLTKWRVGPGWYAMPLLPAPLVAWLVASAFSLTPPLFAADDKAALLLTSLSAGLLGGLFEEIGWTGFAVPRLRLRYSVVMTGLIVGIPRGLWHLLQGLWVSETYAGLVPLAIYLPLNLFSGIAELTAFRILMVWVYDRTQSLLVAVLMHASLIAGTIFLFAPVVSGFTFLSYCWALDAALWLLVGALFVANRVGLRTGGLVSHDAR
jgi:CAAX protease family protein